MLPRQSASHLSILLTAVTRLEREARVGGGGGLEYPLISRTLPSLDRRRTRGGMVGYVEGRIRYASALHVPFRGH